MKTRNIPIGEANFLRVDWLENVKNKPALGKSELFEDIQRDYYNWELRAFTNSIFIDSVDFLLNGKNYAVRELTTRQSSIQKWYEEKEIKRRKGIYNG